MRQKPYVLYALIAILSLIPVGLAHAAQAQASTGTLDVSSVDVLTFLSGIIWAGFGYGVARARNGEPFDPANFFSAVIIGLVLAAIAQSLGSTIDDVSKYTIVQLLTIFLDKMIGAKKKKA